MKMTITAITITACLLLFGINRLINPRPISYDMWPILQSAKDIFWLVLLPFTLIWVGANFGE